MTTPTSPEQLPPVLDLPTAARPLSVVREPHLAAVSARGEGRLLLTVADAAQRLGIGRSLLYELLTSGELESIHIGRLRRIPAGALDAFIDEQRQGEADGR